MALKGRAVSFDRAAEFYDRTRALSPELEAAQTEQLAAELAGAVRCLEIGVGTGRIGLPLAQAGVPMVGVDLSPAMLGVLRSKDAAALPVAVADARALPFAEGTFDAVLACHVLHLVEFWADVVDEAVRVLRPGGRLLVSQGGTPGDESTVNALRTELAAAAGLSEGEARVGLKDRAELDLYLAGCGATVRQLAGLENPTARTIAEFLDQVAQGHFSWTWTADPERVRAAVAQVRASAEARWGDLTAVTVGARTVYWHVYDLP
ncbi:MAG TPA: class I SAM-dependent methyltransferase [Sporichthyaceae bacterium]|nr:class I SAM-dependent methyltransferase [Sporichthyaceae bacterium]